MVFVNVEYAQKESKQLRQLIDEQGKPERPVILFSVAFDQQQAKARWVLSCITSRSGRFSDGKLPEDKRLSKRHQDDEEPIIIYTNEFAALQATQAFCNDRPPAIYTAVILWARVFPRLMPKEIRASWALDENLQGIVEFSTTLEDVIAERKRLLLSMRRPHVIEAINLLEAGNLLVRKKNDELVVRYRRFRPPRVDVDEEDDDDEALEAVIDHAKQGLIRAISRGTTRKGKKQASTPRKSPKDSQQLPLPFKTS